MTTSTAEAEVETPASIAARRGRRVSRFFRVVLAITAAVHVPVALGVAELARRAGVPAPTAVGVAWGILGLWLFAGRARLATPDRRRPGWVVRFLDIPYFIHWCAAVWTLVPSVVGTLVGPAIDLATGAPVHLPVGVYMWSYLSGLVVCGYGVLIRRRWLRIVEREVRLEGLDPRLEGLRIAHLSDLHIGSFTPKSWGLSWARAANGRKPDLAVVTGDLVTSGAEFHADVAEVIGALRAELGTFVSMGNHDYFAEGEPLVALMRAQGIQVLRNEGVELERAGAAIWLAGLDDTWTRRDDMELTLRDRPAGATTILLAHDPLRFDQAADAGVKLVLSGHTHGGQIAVPFIPRAMGLANLAHRYRLGFYERRGSTLYVHPGLGTTGPPFRLGVAPEVTILVLRATGTRA